MTIFHSDPPPWLSDRVLALRPGHGVRINDAQKVSFNGKGYFLWDFREKDGEVYEPKLSLAERLEAMRAIREETERAASDATPPLPSQPFPTDWPVEARVWMHKAHFSNADIMATGAYWNARLARVILPYRTLSGQQAWIGRDVGLAPAGPKYLFPHGVARGGGALVGELTPSGGFAVITEDLLSAWRVHWATGWATVAAQGTSLDRRALVALADQHGAVWLDPDKYGRLGSARIARDLGAFGTKLRQISSRADPKLLSVEEIRAHLMEGGVDVFQS